MKLVDPDLQRALQMLAVGLPEVQRQRAVRKKHAEQDEAKLDEYCQELVEMVEEVIPLNHPDFKRVLMLTVYNKLMRRAKAIADAEEAEFRKEFPPDF
jgi:regulator of sigma D